MADGSAPTPAGSTRTATSRTTTAPKETSCSRCWPRQPLAGVGGVVCVGTDADHLAPGRGAGQDGAHEDLVRSATPGRAIGAGPGSLPGDFGVWATMGLHPHDAVQGVDGARARTRARAPSRERAWWWRWGSVGSTTTTSIRPEPRNATRSRHRSSWRVATTSHSWCTRARRGTTPSTSCAARPSRADGAALLHGRTRGGPALPRHSARSVVQRHRHVQRCTGRARRGRVVPIRSAHGGDRRAVPGASSSPWQAEPAGWVAEVGEAVAEVKGVTPAALAESSTAATRAAFALL